MKKSFGLIAFTLTLNGSAFTAFAMEGYSVDPVINQPGSTGKTDENLNLLKKQIPRVQEYVKTRDHPRLIMGVSNGPHSYSNSEPFISNADDILFDIMQNTSSLQERSLQADFNNLDHLKLLASAFPHSFDVITTDISTTKFANWTEEHIRAFYTMLKPGGSLFIPLDGNFLEIFEGKFSTFDQLKSKMSEDVEKSGYLQLSPFMVNLPAEDRQAILSSRIDEKEISDTKEQLTRFADKLPLSQLSEKEEDKVYSAAFELGVDIDLLFNLTSETLHNEEKLKEFLKPYLYRKRAEAKQNELKDKLMADSIISHNIQRIMGEVFPPKEIIIEKNLTYPHPHKREKEETYAIQAVKK